MSVIIDGYNFLFADRRDMFRLPPGELQKMREDFLGRLARMRAIENSKITVVFDGGQDADLFVREQVWHGVTVLFSDSEGDADAEIVRAVETDFGARDIVVVSNDNELRRAVSKLGANVVSIEEFKRHMKTVFRENAGTTREPLQKFEGVSENEVDFWMQEFGIKEEKEPRSGGDNV